MWPDLYTWRDHVDPDHDFPSPVGYSNFSEAARNLTVTREIN